MKRCWLCGCEGKCRVKKRVVRKKPKKKKAKKRR